MSPNSELHRRLRDTTQSRHRALDRHPLLAPLVAPDLSVLQYENALSALYGVYAAAESWIMDFPNRNPGLFDYESRRTLPALEADLATLGRKQVSCRSAITAPQTVGGLVGILYTIEGSTLGGQVIARLARDRHGKHLPTQFFTGYGALTHQYWVAFLSFADQCCPVDNYEMATRAAVSLFDELNNHLDWQWREN